MKASIRYVFTAMKAAIMPARFGFCMLEKVVSFLGRCCTAGFSYLGCCIYVVRWEQRNSLDDLFSLGMDLKVGYSVTY